MPKDFLRRASGSPFSSNYDMIAHPSSVVATGKQDRLESLHGQARDSHVAPTATKESPDFGLHPRSAIDQEWVMIRGGREETEDELKARKQWVHEASPPDEIVPTCPNARSTFDRAPTAEQYLADWPKYAPQRWRSCSDLYLQPLCAASVEDRTS